MYIFISVYFRYTKGVELYFMQGKEQYL